MNRRLLQLALLAALTSPLAACGGGGGDDDAAEACLKPGVLRSLAVQGQPAPGTAGVFGAFPVGMLMDAAAGGWSVFAASTTDPLAPRGVWGVFPDGTLVPVWLAGETVPDAAGGLIQDFLVVRINASGHVLVEATLLGDLGGRTFGLLSAQLIGGVVAAKHDLIYSTQDMSASGVLGSLTDVDETRVTFVDDGRTFFAGTTASAEALWVVNLDGSGLDAQVQTGDSLPGAVTVLDLKAVGVSRSGNRFAFVADVGGPAEDRLYDGFTGGAAFATIAADTNPLPGGGTILEVHGGGPLLVYDSGSVLWRAQGSLAPPDDVILLGNSTAPYTVLARSGQPAPTGGGALFAALEVLQHRPESGLPMMRAQVPGVPGGNDFATYGLGGQSPAIALYEGRPAPSDLGQSTNFTDTVPSLGVAPFVDVSTDGSFAFAALLANGSSGVFWLVPTCGFFTLAANGQVAPGGDTFGAFSPSATRTVADGVVLFRALLTVSGSGVFRQGP